MKEMKLWGVCRGGVLEKKIQAIGSRGKDPVISKLKGYLFNPCGCSIKCQVYIGWKCKYYAEKTLWVSSLRQGGHFTKLFSKLGRLQWEVNREADC